MDVDNKKYALGKSLETFREKVKHDGHCGVARDISRSPQDHDRQLQLLRRASQSQARRGARPYMAAVVVHEAEALADSSRIHGHAHGSRPAQHGLKDRPDP